MGGATWATAAYVDFYNGEYLLSTPATKDRPPDRLPPEEGKAILERLLRGLRQRGYELVTVSELLRMGPVETVADGYFTVPGDNLKYDEIFPGKGTLKPDPSRPFTTVPVP